MSHETVSDTLSASLKKKVSLKLGTGVKNVTPTCM